MKVTREKQREILAYLLENAELYEQNSPYCKAPQYGYTGLYFCRPGYGHQDYNKWRACDIEGNERFCSIILELWKGLTE